MSQVIILHPKDNVATAVADLAPGDSVPASDIASVKVAEAVPFGHKIALVAIPAGEPIYKYGEPIGLALKDIPAGGYVHVHNVDSQRGRGDLKGA
ncbi:altronate dehydratase small subunit [Polaromonas sp. OV174]|uniref:UxaA family hydrolase n=1 Tax=Polaromonas sp. OV174 TaxID=1855300 RepID=UPI0008E6A688|nr:UxaA family hydrolase [Polaromonas sp. OV174]SFC72363.1 altronate dehydratase small subunit [Polaromonas sp. OV174]